VAACHAFATARTFASPNSPPMNEMLEASGLKPIKAPEEVDLDLDFPG